MTDSVLPVGLRYGAVFAMSGGRIAAPSTLAYEGLEFQGPKAYTINIPNPRVIVHQGNDRVLALDQLPPTEATTGEIRTSAMDLDLDALLSNVLKDEEGVATFIPRNTDQQGTEPLVGVLLYQQALLKADKSRVWHFHTLTSTRCIPIPASFGENAEDHRYTLAPSPSKLTIWGKELSIADNNALEAGILDGFMTLKPKLVAFKTDGAEDEFLFPAAHQAANTDYLVYLDGVSVTVGITKAVTGVTWAAAPATDKIVTVFYETN